MSEPGWYSDPMGQGLRWWDGTTWTHHVHASPPAVATASPADDRQARYRGRSHMAHGAAYWATVGWFWEPVKWCGRMLLWIPPFTLIGVWRSGRHGRKNAERRQRRGNR